MLLSDRVHRERAALRVVDLALTCNRGGDDRVRGRCGMRRGCVLGFTAASYGQAPAAAAAALTSVLVALTRMRPLAVISTARSTEFVPTI